MSAADLIRLRAQLRDQGTHLTHGELKESLEDSERETEEMVGADAMLSRVASTAESDSAMERSRASAKSTALMAMGAFGGGIIVSGGVGALAWKKHRGWGALIGALVVGPLVGGLAAGITLMARAPVK